MFIVTSLDGFVRAGNLRAPEKLQLYLTFGRSTTPLHCNFRYVAPNGWKNVQLYLAFSPSTTPIHCKNRCVAPHGWKNVQLYLAFLRLTWPIPGKGCASRRKCVILRRVQTLDQPIHCKNRCAAPHGRKKCNFTTRSVARPGQSIAKIDAWRLTVWKNVQLYLAVLRLTWPIPGKGCAFPRKYVILRRVPTRSVPDQANPL